MRSSIFALAALFLAAGRAQPEVVDSAANGFTVKVTVNIQASPDDLYRQIVAVGDWWDSQHTFSGDAHNLSIDATATGCFCEKIPNHGSVRHMEVLLAAPGKSLVLTGALGPIDRKSVV